MTVLQLIAVAGGLTEFADGKNITHPAGRERQDRQPSSSTTTTCQDGKKLEQNIVLKPGDTVMVKQYAPDVHILMRTVHRRSRLVVLALCRCPPRRRS